MIYITFEQYEKLKNSFDCIKYDDKEYSLKKECLIKDSSIIEALKFTLFETLTILILKKKYRNLIFFELEVLNNQNSFENFLSCLGIEQTQKISCDNFYLLLDGDKTIEELICQPAFNKLSKHLHKHNTYEKILNFSSLINIKLTTDSIITNGEINEYFLPFANLSYDTNFDIELVGIFTSKDLYKEISMMFSTITYLYELRIPNKPNLISSGNGYYFFDTGNYILGKHKHFGCNNSFYDYYLIEKSKNRIIVICESDNKISHKTIFRNANVFLAFQNKKKGGLNLHSSAIVYKGFSILLLGDKNSGKTTNMLFGLRKDHTDFQSNDLVHLSYKDNTLFSVGSNRKAPIRKKTLTMFQEFKYYNFDDEYSTKGLQHTKGDYTAVLNIQSLTKLFNKRIIASSPVGAIILVNYDVTVNKICINELSNNQKLDVLRSNLHEFYNGIEKFWNDLYPIENYIFQLEPFKRIPFFEIKVNQNNIEETWEELFCKLEQNL